MYKDIYRDNKAVEITAVQVLSIGIIILVSLVLPASFIYKLQTDTLNQVPYTASTISRSSSGTVAGASTEVMSERKIRIPLTNSYIDLNTESGVLTVAGLLFLAVGVILLFYLILK